MQDHDSAWPCKDACTVKAGHWVVGSFRYWELPKRWEVVSLLQPLCSVNTRFTTQLTVIHACATQSFILQLNGVCKLYSPYAACNVWRAIFPSSKLKFPWKKHSCSVKVIWLLCFDCPPIAIAALLLKEWKYSVGNTLFAYSFFLPLYCFVLILYPSKTWNKKQTKNYTQMQNANFGALSQ